ncbi:hypothetical protein AB0G64_32490 [Streptomyces longwoodensis]
MALSGVPVLSVEYRRAPEPPFPTPPPDPHIAPCPLWSYDDSRTA